VVESGRVVLQCGGEAAGVLMPVSEMKGGDDAHYYLH
jgi:hypothetical protein